MCPKKKAEAEFQKKSIQPKPEKKTSAFNANNFFSSRRVSARVIWNLWYRIIFVFINYPCIILVNRSTIKSIWIIYYSPAVIRSGLICPSIIVRSPAAIIRVRVRPLLWPIVLNIWILIEFQRSCHWLGHLWDVKSCINNFKWICNNLIIIGRRTILPSILHGWRGLCCMHGSS